MMLKVAFGLLLVIGLLLMIRVLKKSKKRSVHSLESLLLLVYDSILIYFAVLVVGILLGLLSSYLFE
ncbi:hypothetical protein CULT_2250007 [[Clostridium] ultunense Esp]|nr:hypothetical protein CULT_2250007 [[Clostridium] ultunense Esp]